MSPKVISDSSVSTDASNVGSLTAAAGSLRTAKGKAAAVVVLVSDAATSLAGSGVSIFGSARGTVPKDGEAVRCQPLSRAGALTAGGSFEAADATSGAFDTGGTGCMGGVGGKGAGCSACLGGSGGRLGGSDCCGGAGRSGICGAGAV